MKRWHEIDDIAEQKDKPLAERPESSFRFCETIQLFSSTKLICLSFVLV